MRQVIEHTGSGMYQRSFRELALDFGWGDSMIIEIDEDDGKSGTETTKRKGFQRLRRLIFEGQVGALFCWEASRLARDNADFFQLIKLCAACDTLIIDEKTVYDLNNVNDNMAIGIQGLMGYAESRRTGDRSIATKRMKAEAGELRLRPPTEYVYDDEDNLIFDPDVKVQEAFRLFFRNFDRLGSATKLVKHFNRKGILFPTRRGRGKKSAIVWGGIDIHRALIILHNPTFAGTFAFGITKTTREMLSADATEQKKKIVKVDLDSDGPVIIHGAHEGYITWEKFTQNQKIIKANRNGPDDRFKGAVRDGSALLQGLGMCGACSRKLTIHYDGRDGSAAYECSNKVRQFGTNKCLAIASRRLDETVTDAFLKAVSPAQLQITLRELEEVNKETQIDDGDGKEELESAKVECENTRRLFEAIDPSHTWLIKDYGEKLQEKMIKVSRLEKKYAKESKAPRQDLTKAALKSLLALPQDVRKFWECDAVTNAERKQLLRCVISKVIIRRLENSKYQDVFIHWVGGAITPYTILANGRLMHPEAVALMRKLAPDHTIPQIIDCLHEAGFKSKGGKEWFSPTAVYQAFKAYGIKFACPQISMGGDKPRGDGRYSSTVVAGMLNVSLPTIYRWCNSGILDGIRDKAPKSNYWIKITPEQLAAFRNRSVKRIDKSVLEKFKIT
jgi:DNA invertase Pin-like site-specific DNA recombinase